MSDTRRLGLLGGTFDPIHCGHLDVAEAARRALALPEVRLIPSRLGPHRRSAPAASSYHRFAMVALAAVEREGLVASDLELRAPGPSYTALTLDHLIDRGYEAAQIFFVAGADAFAEIATWYGYPGLLQLCQFVVVSRPGFPVAALPARLPDLAPFMREIPPAPDSAAPAGAASLPAILLLDTRTTDASSTEIRRRLQAGERLGGLTPPLIETYIRRHGLYRPGSSAADHLHEQA